MRPSLMRVAHIVPSMFVGGVEIAIQRSLADLKQSIDYRVFWVKRRGVLPVDLSHVCNLLWTTLSGRWRPDVVVTSLWYAHPFGRLLALLGIRWIGFFHNSGFSNPFDRVVQRWAWHRAEAVFVDSAATLSAMSEFGIREAVTIPYIFPESAISGDGVRDIGLIWVGRAVRAKRLDLFLELVRLFRRSGFSGRCIAILAGAGADEIDTKVQESQLRLEVLRNRSNEEVRRLLSRSRYFVLTSDYEGMSMTTIESIQCGCIPVVRQVGEIGSYLDDASGFLMRDASPSTLDAAVARVLELENSPDEAAKMVVSARRKVQRLGTYVESFRDGLTMIGGRSAP